MDAKALKGTMYAAKDYIERRGAVAKLFLKSALEGKQLNEHIFATYKYLRRGLALVAFLLPIALVSGGIYGEGAVQDSLSAYYHAGDGAMRNVFVGALCAAGISLILYRGYSDQEDWALNFAGGFVILVAMLPMEWPPCVTSCSWFSWHYIFAVLFFVSIAYVCIFTALDTLSLLSDNDVVRRYKRRYRRIGVLMIVVPASVFLVTKVVQPTSWGRFTVIGIEWVGVWIFALYWFVKSGEIAKSNSERSDPIFKKEADYHLP
jgi:hypothetical protein